MRGRANLSKCSNLLNDRPQDGIGHVCDVWGYGPTLIAVLLFARLSTPLVSGLLLG